jgi:hypothetical protein
MALVTVPVHGEILDPDGLTPAVGTITFRTLIELRDTVDNIVYLPSEFTATLDALGEFTINLPTTDNADITPINWVYQVFISTTTWRDTQYVQIPFQVGTVEYADLTPLDYNPCEGLPAPTPIPPSDYTLFVLRSGDTMTGPLILDDASEAASQAWVLANAPGGVPANSVVTEQAFGQASAVGVSLEYAREDHTHGTPNAPAALVPADSVVTETAFGQASAVGVSLEYAREDHTHGTPASPAVPAAGNTIVTETSFGQAATAGASALYSRVDHTHGTPASPAVPTPANAIVTETAFGQASAVGVNATEFAREDHAHGTPAAPTAASVGADPAGSAAAAQTAAMAYTDTEIADTRVYVDDSGIITTGTITVPTTAPATQIGPDLVVTASAGDVLELVVSCLCADTGGELYWNAATRVGGADLNYFGTGTNSWPFPPGGISSFFTPVNIFTGPRAARTYVVQAGDIVAGQVTVRVYARADNSSRDVFATAAQPLQTRLVNFRQ